MKTQPQPQPTVNDTARTPQPHAASASNWMDLAERVLNGAVPERREVLSILAADDAEVPELLAAAYRIRHHYYGNAVKLNYLVNAKSGICPEDCHYCSQSRDSQAPIDRYALRDGEQLMAGAERAIAMGASTCCIVMSGRGPVDHEVDDVANAVSAIKSKHPSLKICACLGILNDGQAERLRAAGVDRYNHNLNTADSHHDDVCSTHTYHDRVATVEKAKRAGISPCSGVIVGMGESHEQLVDVAYALRELDSDSIPVNFLIPIEGTPFAEMDDKLTPRFCLKVLCMFRFVCPTKEIRSSAGREVHLRSLQPLSLYPANSLFVSDYLTEPGQDPHLDHQMIEDAGFVVETVG